MNHHDTTLHAILSRRLNGLQVKLLTDGLRHNTEGKTQLFALLTNGEKRVADNAAWLLSHIASKNDAWFDAGRCDTFRTLAMRTSDDTLRRLLLTILHAVEPTPTHTETSVAFLDFCLAGVASTLPVATRALCLKLALPFCLPYPELQAELELVMAQAEDGEVPPALRATLKAVRKQLKRGRSGYGKHKN